MGWRGLPEGAWAVAGVAGLGPRSVWLTAGLGPASCFGHLDCLGVPWVLCIPASGLGFSPSGLAVFPGMSCYLSCVLPGTLSWRGQ